MTADDNELSVTEIRLQLGLERLQDAPLGTTRLGGWPDLPPGVEWPRVEEHTKPESIVDGAEESHGKRLPFVAQIDCAALPHWPGSKLPTEGWLYVFMFLSNDTDSECRVLYRTGPREELTRGEWRIGDENIAADRYGHRVYEYLKVEAIAVAEIDREKLVDLLREHPETGWRMVTDTKEKEKLLKAWDEGDQPSSVRVHHSNFSNDRFVYRRDQLGPGEATEEDLPAPLEELHHLAASGTVAHLLGNPIWGESANEMAGYDWGHGRTEGDWLSLFDLSSCGHFEWSDSGYLNLLIREPALAARDFSDVLQWVSSS